MNKRNKLKNCAINDKIDADATWKRVMEEALKGNIDFNIIGSAMARCNFCDEMVLRENPKYRNCF